MSYYKRQLEKLNIKSEYPVTIVLTDGDGNKTNHLSVNLESIPELKEWFEKVIDEQIKRESGERATK